MIPFFVRCIIVALFSGLNGGNDLKIRRSTIDGGGVIVSSGGALVLSATIGQPDAGAVMTGGSLVVTGGFWFPAVSGDCDGEGTVTILDHMNIPDCLSGPFFDANGGCGCIDTDGDGDVDLSDVANFANSFTAP